VESRLEANLAAIFRPKAALFGTPQSFSTPPMCARRIAKSLFGGTSLFPTGKRDRDSVGEGIRLLKANGDLAIFLQSLLETLQAQADSIEFVVCGEGELFE
jgi:hypothetical protein